MENLVQLASMDVESLLKIAAVVAAVLGGRWGLVQGAQRVRSWRNGGTDLPPGSSYAMVGLDAQDITNPKLKPVTQGECALTKEALLAKMDEQGRRLESHGQQIVALDKSVDKMNITLTEIGGDIREMRAGLPGQIHKTARSEVKDHEAGPLHKD